MKILPTGGEGAPLLVVAAALAGAGGTVLLQQRLPGKRHGGQWEFPGGKIEPGETGEAALAREIAEELDVAVSLEGLAEVARADEPASGTHPGIVLILYRVPRWSGTPRGVDGQAWGWFTPAEAALLPLAPMDRVLLAELSGGVLDHG